MVDNLEKRKRSALCQLKDRKLWFWKQKYKLTHIKLAGEFSSSLSIDVQDLAAVADKLGMIQCDL